MIGSVSDFQRDIAEQERRRQQIAAQQPAVPSSHQDDDNVLIAGPIAAGYASAPMALKATEPQVAKRKKGKEGKRQDRVADEVATGAIDAGRGWRDAMEDEHAGKAFRDGGIAEGPGDAAEPGRIAPAEFDRPYLSAGHAAESPMSGAPRQMPIVHAPQGIVQPIELPGALVAGYVPAHVTQALSMGSPSDR